MKKTVQISDYILHLGETGQGLGVALVWHESSVPVAGHATVAAESANKRNLLIDDGAKVLSLLGVESQLFERVLQDGLYIIWQDSSGTVQHKYCAAITKDSE